MSARYTAVVPRLTIAITKTFPAMRWRGEAERDHRPDEEEASAWEFGDLRANTRPSHVNDGDGQPKERPEKNDDVSRSPFGERQRSIQPDDQNGYSNEVGGPSLFHPADDVVRQMKRRQE